jgi:hypothetical protein
LQVQPELRRGDVEVRGGAGDVVGVGLQRSHHVAKCLGGTRSNACAELFGLGEREGWGFLERQIVVAAVQVKRVGLGA